MIPSLVELRAQGVLSRLDQHFAVAMARIEGEERPEVLLALAFASRQVAEGDVCLDLPALVATVPPWAEERTEPSAGGRSSTVDAERDGWPPLAPWLAALHSSGLIARVSDASEATEGDTRAASSSATPLVIDGSGRLYLRRYWDAEQRLAEAIRRRLASPPRFAPGGVALGEDPEALRESIARLLPGEPSDLGEDVPDWRRVAAAVAAGRRFAVVAGGPGTGKTTTAARLLAVLIECELRAGRPVPRIALLAPTGKAAARLGDAIARERGKLVCDEAVRDAIPTEAATIHRRIIVGQGARRRRGPAVPLPVDAVLVDEASMVDLALMARLIAAIPPASRLILLGDPDQLASVEAGSVLGDLCGDARPRYSAASAAWLSECSGERVPCADLDGGASQEVPAINDCIVTLTRSHRYAPGSGIGALARAINRGDVAAALEVLDDAALTDVARVDLDPHGRPGDVLANAVLEGYGPLVLSTDPARRLDALTRFRVLCVVRRGPQGVAHTNHAIDALLVEKGLLEPAVGDPKYGAPGRPLLVTRNAAHVDLYNGDVGVWIRADGGLRAAFASGAEGEGEGQGGAAIRSIAPARLPPFEPVFAMTVHKSQGSEFDEVALLLPERDTVVLTRELLYTAVTRARRRIVVHGTAAAVARAIDRPTSRASGLREALWRLPNP